MTQSEEHRYFDDDYSQVLRERGIQRRANSASHLVQLVKMPEEVLALENSADAWLITIDYKRTRGHSVNFVSALNYVEQLDEARHLVSTGVVFPEPITEFFNESELGWTQ